MSIQLQNIGKLETAIDLTAKPKNQEEAAKYNENLSKGISILNQLCLSTNLTSDDKLDVIIKYLKAVPDCALDMLIRWRDMIPFLRSEELNDMISLLVKITRSPEISSHERMATAVTLYNNCFLMECYGCFADIACDRSVLVDYRIDAARYLFSSQSEDHVQTAQEALLEVIDTDEYPSDYRYKIIACFISRTGINTMMNMVKLRVPYDEEFVYGLQTNFFYNDANGVRERILSGQHLMQMECVDEEEKSEVGETLLGFATDKNLDDNTRADAADVVLRLGEPKQKKEARNVIVDLGFSAVDKIGCIGSLMDRARTIYNDSQNIHEFGEQVDKFIEKIINETTIIIKPFHEVHNQVAEYLRKHVKANDERFRAFKALNRISIDTARFTSYKVTLAEIFVHVWARIQTYEDQVDLLMKRMAEELVEMGDTCSSGHSGRFVNVLAEVDTSLKISWGEQIKANMTGRMMARIRDCKDSDLRARLAMAESEFAEEEDTLSYNKFIRDNLDDLKEELRKEFVGEGYVTTIDFEEYFTQGETSWM